MQCAFGSRGDAVMFARPEFHPSRTTCGFFDRAQTWKCKINSPNTIIGLSLSATRLSSRRLLFLIERWLGER